jgi:RND family efflux transporter MFP subunit
VRKGDDPFTLLRSPCKAAAVATLALACLGGCHDAGPSNANEQPPVTNAALTVSLVSPVIKRWSDRLVATGNIEPWQLMRVGAEVSGVRVVEVLADVGDSVHKGQLLARLDDAAARVDLSIQQAALAQAQADLAQAQVSLSRAKKLIGTQVISQQDLLQSETTAKTSAARLAMAEAQIEALQLKVRNTRIVAPDDGIVAARSTSVGALIDGSSELFQLVRKGRIEWRAQLRPEQLGQVEIGQPVQMRDPLGNIIEGRVRQIAPTADEVSRRSLVYVDVPPSRSLEPGVLATGEFELQERMALTVPNGSLTLRDGFNYSMSVGQDGLIKPIKVQIGEQHGDDVDRVKVVQVGPDEPAMASTAPDTMAARARHP